MDADIVSLHTEGKLVKGFSSDECRRLLCEKLKLNEKTVVDLLSGKELVIKKEIAYDKSNFLVNKFSECGLVVYIVINSQICNESTNNSKRNSHNVPNDKIKKSQTSVKEDYEHKHKKFSPDDIIECMDELSSPRIFKIISEFNVNKFYKEVDKQQLLVFIVLYIIFSYVMLKYFHIAFYILSSILLIIPFIFNRLWHVVPKINITILILLSTLMFFNVIPSIYHKEETAIIKKLNSIDNKRLRDNFYSTMKIICDSYDFAKDNDNKKILDLVNTKIAAAKGTKLQIKFEEKNIEPIRSTRGTLSEQISDHAVDVIDQAGVPGLLLFLGMAATSSVYDFVKGNDSYYVTYRHRIPLRNSGHITLNFLIGDTNKEKLKEIIKKNTTYEVNELSITGYQINIGVK